MWHAIFEIGPAIDRDTFVHSSTTGKFREFNEPALFAPTEEHGMNWIQKSNEKLSFYCLKFDYCEYVHMDFMCRW